MIRDGLLELLSDLYKSLGYGALSGVLYACVVSVISILVELIRSPTVLLDSITDKNGIKKLWRMALSEDAALASVQLFFVDFIALTLVGVGFIVLCYVCNDGIFRAYLLLAVLASALMTYSIVGKRVSRISLFIFGMFKNICITVIAVLTRPIFVLICHSIKHLNASKHLDKAINK